MEHKCAHCAKKKERTEKEYKDLINRLNRIEGQVRALLDRAVEQQAGMVSPKRYIGNIAQKRKIELLEEQNEKLLKEMAALQEENNRLKKALGKRALNTIKNL